ncbi:hypothetical protein [Marinomonas shanghaiensis]
MAQPKLAGSASLHLTLGAFGGLFALLSVSFAPIVAFALTLVTAIVLAKL